MVELVRAGRDPFDVAREFEPTAPSICHCVTQAGRQEGRREEKGRWLGYADRDESPAAKLETSNCNYRAATRPGEGCIPLLGYRSLIG
jgi:hypothetical protein